jgi:molybdopterin molybdotransferase
MVVSVYGIVNRNDITHRKGVARNDLMPVEAAITRFLSYITDKTNCSKLEYVHISEAGGRVLAEDIRASIDLPPFDRADRDGFALRSSDTKNASVHSTILLDVVGKQLAGITITARPLRKGQALEIATGARLPKGVDSVIMVEDVIIDSSNKLIKTTKSVNRGDYVSTKGSDIKKHQLVLKKGTWLTFQDIALIASIGLNRVLVREKPKVGILATGDELTEPGQTGLSGSSIFECNRYMLSCLVKDCGGEPVDLGLCSDDRDEIYKRLLSALECDIVVVSGGASVGEKDYLHSLIDRLGKPGIVAHGIAMKPGSPTGLGIIGNKPIIMCPGFPVSAFAAFYIFGKSLLFRMMGTEGPLSTKLMAEMTESIAVYKDFLTLVRVIVYRHNGKFFAKPVSASGANLISTLTRSNGIVVVNHSPSKSKLQKGEMVEVALIRNIVNKV